MIGRSAFVRFAWLGSLLCGATAVSGYELELHLHSSEVTPAEFGAADALLPVVAAAKTVRPVGSQYDFIGVAAGAPVWLLPKNQNPSVLFLSIGTEELAAADFSTPLVWSLVTVTGSGGAAAPGSFSVWNVDNFGSVVPLMSTASGTATPNAFSVAPGTHTHFNYGFTAPGLYNIEFTASGTLSAALGGGPVTGTATYSFGVFDTGSDYQFPITTPWTYEGQSFSVPLVGNEHIDMGLALTAVPEPAMGAGVLTLFGAAGACVVRRRGRKPGFPPSGPRAG
jgi:surface-anchored protein